MSGFFEIDVIDVDEDFVSVFRQEKFPKIQMGEMLLTDRIEVQNLRLRESNPGYESDWHVAGDATLILVQSGSLSLELRNKECKTFVAGDSFIAKDYLPKGVSFEDSKHGHKAKVVGKEVFRAVHIKLTFQD